MTGVGSGGIWQEFAYDYALAGYAWHGGCWCCGRTGRWGGCNRWNCDYGLRKRQPNALWRVDGCRQHEVGAVVAVVDEQTGIVRFAGDGLAGLGRCYRLDEGFFGTTLPQPKRSTVLLLESIISTCPPDLASLPESPAAPNVKLVVGV